MSSQAVSSSLDFLSLVEVESIDISEVAVAGLGPVAIAVAGLVPGVLGFVSDRTSAMLGSVLAPKGEYIVRR